MVFSSLKASDQFNTLGDRNGDTNLACINLTRGFWSYMYNLCENHLITRPRKKWITGANFRASAQNKTQWLRWMGFSYLLAAPLPHPLAFRLTVLSLLQDENLGAASTGTRQSEHPGSGLLLYPGFSGMLNVLLHPRDIPLWSAEHK